MHFWTQQATEVIARFGATEPSQTGEKTTECITWAVEVRDTEKTNKVITRFWEAEANQTEKFTVRIIGFWAVENCWMCC